jgi:serine/threonine protein kinase
MADRNPANQPTADHQPASATPTRTLLHDAASAPSAAPANVNRYPFLKPAQAENELGSLGNYRIVRLLGEGGMGFVFLAQDRQLERLVALKVMRPDVAAEPAARARFLREGRTVAALKSDHIITIYQVGEANGAPFLAMELLTGHSLADWLQQQNGPPPEAVITKVASDVLMGLVVAQTHGLIHRDIKPHNLWVEPNPVRIKLLDFGLTRGQSDPRLTQTGTILGTPAYMAPEQANALAVDGRADLFSVGAVLYRMAAGRPPFERRNVMATLLALAMEPVVPPPGLSPGLTQFILRLLARDPNQRPATASVALQELQQLLANQPTAPPVPVAQLLTNRQAALANNLWANLDDDDEPTTAVPPVRPPTAPSRRTWLIAGGVGMVGVVAGGLVWTRRPGPPRPIDPPPAPPVVAPPVPAPPPPPAVVQKPRQWLTFTGKTMVRLPGWELTTDGPLTVEAWVRRAHQDNNFSIFELRGPQKVLSLYGDTDGGYWTADGCGRRGLRLMARTLPLTPPGEWVHVAVTWPGAVPTLFVNGYAMGQGATNYNAPTINFVGACLGDAYDEGNQVYIRPFVGQLGGVRISSSVRYKNAFVPPAEFPIDEQTVALYPCHDGQGDVLTDLVPPGKPGQILGGTWQPSATAPGLVVARPPLGNPDDLKGWVLLGPGEWKLEGGVLTGTGNGWLQTEQEWEDFDLAFEVRLPPGGDGGVFLRSTPAGLQNHQVLELQLADQTTPAAQRWPEHERAGSLYNAIAPKPAVFMRPKEWHSVQVRMQGSILQVRINGQQVIDADLLGPAYGQRQKILRGYQPKGYLMFQSVDPGIEYRHLRIARLVPAGMAPK